MIKLKAWGWPVWPKHVAWYNYQTNKGVLTEWFYIKLVSTPTAYVKYDEFSRSSRPYNEFLCISAAQKPVFMAVCSMLLAATNFTKLIIYLRYYMRNFYKEFHPNRSIWTVRVGRGHALVQLVEAPGYKSEVREFDSRWRQWNFSLI